MSEEKPTFKELEAWLAEAEKIIEVLRNEEVVPVISRENVLPLRREEAAEKALQNVYDVIERGVEQRTADLGMANERLKQAEEELREYRTHLEVLVKKRTAELIEANEQLEREIAERRLAEEALRESEERYRAVFEQAADSIVLVDAKTGALVDFNERAHTNLCYTREEFEKVKIPDFEAVESGEEVARHIEKVLEQGRDVFETKHRRKDGEIRDIEVSSRAISIRGKDFLQNIFRDITEGKRAEEALRESEEKYRSLTEDSLTGIFIHQDGRYVFVNDRFAGIHGYRSEELLGRDVLTLVHPDERALVEQRASERLKGEAVPQCYEVRRLRKDGKAIWCETMVTLIRYGGRPAFMGNVIDITERKLAGGALQESEEKYRTLVEGSLDGIAVVQGDEVKLVNQALLQMFGLQSEEEIVGHPFTDFVSPKYRNLMAERGSAREEGEEVPNRYEFKALKLDESEFDVEISVNPIVYKGKPARQAFLRDVSKRKRAEDALRES